MESPPFTSNRRAVPSPRTHGIVVLGLLATSALLLAIAPAFMPDSYLWIEHTTSESAAQGVEHAWMARTGFLLLAAAVWALSVLADRRWGLWGRLAHRVYAVGAIGVATFATKPWEDVDYVKSEELLHSIAASVVGLGFTAGVLVVLLRRPIADHWGRVFDWMAIAASPTITAIMFSVDNVAGVTQRAMFLIGYLWYGREAVRSMSAAPESPTPEPLAVTSEELQAA